MTNVVMLSAIMGSVVAPTEQLENCFIFVKFETADGKGENAKQG